MAKGSSEPGRADVCPRGFELSREKQDGRALSLLGPTPPEEARLAEICELAGPLPRSSNQASGIRMHSSPIWIWKKRNPKRRRLAGAVRRGRRQVFQAFGLVPEACSRDGWDLVSVRGFGDSRSGVFRGPSDRYCRGPSEIDPLPGHAPTADRLGHIPGGDLWDHRASRRIEMSRRYIYVIRTDRCT